MTDWIKGVAGAALGPDTNMDLLIKYTGVPREDIVAAHFSSLEFLRPAHYVAIDRRVGAVVIAVRGTMSLTDTLTDIVATPSALQVQFSVLGRFVQTLLSLLLCLFLLTAFECRMVMDMVVW